MVKTRDDIPTYYFCVDWGASFSRQYNSYLGQTSRAQHSLAIYNKESRVLLTGEKAHSKSLEPNNSSWVGFPNLKSVFDLDSSSYRTFKDKIDKHQLDITVEDILENWWKDRFKSDVQRIPKGSRIIFAVAHPANFSAQSVQKYQEYFKKSRCDHYFQVIASEESTAALHGSRYSDLNPDSWVIVVDGGKSTIDCACLQITKVNDNSLTTIIYKTKGLSNGADFINQEAMKYAQPKVQEFAQSNEIGMELHSILTLWWQQFETNYKRDLENAKRSYLLEKIGCIPVPGLMKAVEEASIKLAKQTEMLIVNLIQEVEKIPAVSIIAIICLGGYCQSNDLRTQLQRKVDLLNKSRLTDHKIRLNYELDDSDGNDVIRGLRNLARNPERAEWHLSPQHYFITQNREENDVEQEALLLYQQGDELIKSRDAIKLDPDDIARIVQERQKTFKTPYEFPGHFITMSVVVDDENCQPNEPILYQLELSTANTLKYHLNRSGFKVMDLKSVSKLGGCYIKLPSSYRKQLLNGRTLQMYICLAAEGQNIVLKAIRPREDSSIPDIEWLTLPEVVGTFGRNAIDDFSVSVQVTMAINQGLPY